MKRRIEALKTQIALEPGSAAQHSSLASYYDLLQDTSSALDSLNIATALNPRDKNIAWLHLKVKQSKILEEKRISLQEKLAKCSSVKYNMPVPTGVSCHLS